MARNVLDQKRTFLLMGLVQSDYTKSGMDDPTFAKAATEKLGFMVSSGNIYGCRQSLGINSNSHNAKKNFAKEEINAAITELADRLEVVHGGTQVQLADLERRLKVVEGLLRVKL